MTQMISMNPYTGKQNQAYQSFDLGLLDDALSRVSQAQKVWAEQSLAARAQYLQKLASLLREKKDELARLATSEMGKTLSSLQRKSRNVPGSANTTLSRVLACWPQRTSAEKAWTER